MTEKVFERLLEEAVCKMAQEEEQSYPSRSELQERYRLSDRFYQRMEQLILKVEQGEMRKGRRTKAAICAACLLLFIIWWYPDTLVKAKESLWEWFRTHVSFDFGWGNTSLQKYQIGYIPDGYEVVFDDLNEKIGTVLLESKNGNKIELVYTFIINRTEIDNKEKDFKVLYEEELPIYYLESDIGEANILIWEDEEHDIVFTLISALDYDEMNKIRRGIQPAEGSEK
ncbi:MAG: DUF4367 domain-containing protein [Lachnospiraceae bacterium]